MADRLIPRTAIDRGPAREEFVELDQQRPEALPEAGGDTGGMDIDSNVGGAAASAGLDSGGAVGVRRGLAVGRPGFEYDLGPEEAGETIVDFEPVPSSDEDEEGDLPAWADARLEHI